MKIVKKNILLYGVIIFFLLCITTKYLTSAEYKVSFDFNYLNNNQIITNTKELLLNNKIPKENIDLWLECVKKYNLKSKTFIQDTSDGWTKTSLSDYNRIDFTKNLNGWSEEEDYLDLNCRISAFILIKDRISSNCFMKKYNSDIEKEINKMDDIFCGKITDKNATTFRSLFTPIEMKMNNLKNISVYDETLKNLKSYWEKEGLTFKNNNSSLIQVVLIEQNNNDVSATIGHAGLLVKNSSILYFIEKKNPCFPYQISKFKNYDDLNQYIIAPFKDLKNCKLMILQNDNMIFKYDI